ncbi:hypothetical protein CLV57_0497 [Mucilaginibacter auburnensis]|uniref:Uncharacterized protein n=2 Tax=Mucilaginibacter auburnensis TaxID=1457233 RepID=A0A2H9VRS1_9SPHI|nr:hypothetical protein CLV57_0497 [Mucilaginibacter auburnensis]
MSPEEKKDLIIQVAKVIKRQNSSETYPYYHDFINICSAYGLDEYAFNMEILPNAYSQVPKVINSGPHCVIFGERCFTTEQMGLVFFNHPSKSEIYMKDDAFFRKDIREIEDADKSMELLEVFNSETLIDRRYLKFVYHLNKNLPYRVETFYAENIDALITKGFDDVTFYNLILKEFLQGYIHIWLEQTDLENFAKLKQHDSYHDFLTFIYAVNKNYPFYVNTQTFKTPQELVVFCQQDPAFRPALHKSLTNGNIQIWLHGIGKQDWYDEYLKLSTYINNLADYSDNEKLALRIQALQHVADPALSLPYLNASVKKIDFINIEGARPVISVFNLTCDNIGYVKARLSLRNTVNDNSLQPESITLSNTVIDFNSFEGKTVASVTVEVNPLHFVKDKQYSFEISIATLYQAITIPVTVTVVFPKKEYAIYLAKYAAFGAVFFLLIRAIDEKITDRQDFYPEIPTFAGIYNSFEDFYWKYIIVFIIMLCGLILSFRLIKKLEKL